MAYSHPRLYNICSPTDALKLLGHFSTTLESVNNFVASLPILPVSLADPPHASMVGGGGWGVSMKCFQECSLQTKRSSLHGKQACGSNSCQFPNTLPVNGRFFSTASARDSEIMEISGHRVPSQKKQQKNKNTCGFKQSE